MSDRNQRALLGFDPILMGIEELSARWSADLILSLDWCRVVELARAMALFGGFEFGKTRVHANGAADFLMTRGKGAHAQKYRVHAAAWNQWQATVGCVETFAEGLRKEKNTRGVFLAPGGFAASALHRAQRYQIETVDAELMAARLNELPETHSTFFYEAGTLGDCSTPSCPVCMKRMELQPEPDPEVSGRLASFPDLCFRSRDIVAEPVAARRIEILHHCEVYFLRGVHARDVVVHGLAIGNFVCDGCLLINAGATVEGTVAARSIMVRPGAVLNGETRILKTAPSPLAAEEPSVYWRCGNPKGRPGCEKVKFRLH